MASEPILLGALAILAAGMTAYAYRTEKRMKLILQGKNAASLEDSLAHISKQIEELGIKEKEIRAHLSHIESRLVKSIQKVETVRFNAFKDSGGGQSFATAFLDEKGTGVVLSTLYSRDRVSVFSKPIETYTSSFALTPEEAAAIEKAQA